MGFIDTPYNLTALQSSVSISDLFVYANTSTNGLLTGIMLIAVFFILLVSFKASRFAERLAAAGFITFVLSVFALVGGFISFYMVIVFLVVTALSVLYLSVTK